MTDKKGGVTFKLVASDSKSKAALSFMGASNQEKLKKRFLNSLAQVVADIRDPKEAVSFLQEIIPDGALDTAVKKLGVAYLLNKGWAYRKIGRKLSLSSATIAEISKKINEESGVKIALDKMLADEWAGYWARKINLFLTGRRNTSPSKKPFSSLK